MLAWIYYLRTGSVQKTLPLSRLSEMQTSVSLLSSVVSILRKPGMLSLN